MQRNEQRELLQTIDAKDAEIADLQVEVQAKEALLEAHKNGTDLDQVGEDEDRNIKKDVSGNTQREEELKECYGQLIKPLGMQR